ncbi:4Fe-4S binding protein [Phragmitibacter flavus]|uniref:4Fe-4S binding protein n=1 Tax=Phragmitibacter flavus TaxID=2576071 RepID=A0A5R8KDP0_9BACT|nr:4Fe-4S binding protein [Phragmitibacter flavus]TLD70416.1 4Fe-4S binding protein [Phragmitibacter flavus]
MLHSAAHSILLRAWRAGVLVAIAWLIHQQHDWLSAQRDATLTPDRIRDFFPEADSLGPRDPQSGIQKVLNTYGDTLGLVTQTSPVSDNIIGYSGPTNSLIALDPQARVIGIRILHSDDTSDHLATVLKNRPFFNTFKNLKLGDLQPPEKIDLVSGATLTSDAIAQGILKRLGGNAPSLRFPEPLTLAEIQKLKPDAAQLQPLEKHPDIFQVLDAQQNILAQVTRTAPQSDAIVGYKGPSDTLIVLDPTGTKIESFHLRKSFDNAEYVAYATGDKFFAKTFTGMTLDQLATLDFNAAGIAGATGATQTSWAMSEGMKRRAAALIEPPPSASLQIQLPTLKPADYGLLAVIAFSVLMTFTSLRGKRWARALHQIALIGYAGLYSGAMISQGLLTGWSRHGVPWQSAPVLLLLTALALALPLFTRRQFYCHHYCPHGALQQWLSKRLKNKNHLRIPAPLNRLLETIPLLLLTFILVIVMLGLNIDINKLEAFDAWLVTVAGWGILLTAIAGLIFSLFTPMAYCRYGCPTGALLKFVRYAGASDHFGKKDAVALALLLLAALLHWQLAWT